MFPWIAGLPGLIAVVVCIRRGAKEAFLCVYLPTVLLLPDDYRWPITGHLTFHEAAIIPIAVWFLFNSWRTWKFSLTDVLLVGYCAFTVISQFHNRNFYDARNTALRDATYIVFPYMLAKGLFYRGDFGLEVAKRITILLAIVSIVSVYEFKMTVDLFDSFVRPFFSVPDTYWIETLRYGLTRIAGPFGHALGAGIILLVGFRFARWLEWSGYWRQRIPFVDISAVRFCELSILAGAAMTVARGAWTSAIVGSLVVLFGRAHHRVRTLAVMIAALLVVGPPLYWGLHAYVVPRAGREVSFSQQTAAYRIDLIADYLPIIEQRPALGYGQGWNQKDSFPVINGMWSIDDQYVFIALIHGLYALALWVVVLLWMLVRLLRFGLQRPGDDLRGSLAWTLAGACTLYALVSATVSLGGQTGLLLYMIWGWGEGLLVSRFSIVQGANRSVGVAPGGAVGGVRAMAGVIVPMSACIPG